MAEIQPFRAVRYNPDVAGDVSLHICPPFDVITPQLQQELYDRSPYNIVRLELARRGLSEDPYEQAAETSQLWLDSGALKHEGEPSIYVTEEEFEYQGQKLFRRGFVAAVRLEDYDQEIVLPHEGTRSEWVADRVADNGRLVVGRALAAQCARFNVLLGVVPGTARVRHHDGEQEASGDGAYEHRTQCGGS